MDNILKVLVGKNGDLNMDKIYDTLAKNNNKCVFLLYMLIKDYPALGYEQKLIDYKELILRIKKLIKDENYNFVQAGYVEGCIGCEEQIYIYFTHKGGSSFNDKDSFIYIHNYPKSKNKKLFKLLSKIEDSNLDGF
uniref:Uncharacterized protein n=1 Tax=viral metagenome TaxID=1070528 RepID=A0A6C0AD03_9ZZZZ